MYSQTKSDGLNAQEPFFIGFFSMMKNINWIVYKGTELWKKAGSSKDLPFGEDLEENSSLKGQMFTETSSEK